MKIISCRVTAWLTPVVLAVLSAAGIALVTDVSAATIEVTKYYAGDPNNGKYDRNPSLTFHDNQRWLFYTKGDDGSTGGVRGLGYNPDNDSYVIWYKANLDLEQGFGGPEPQPYISGDADCSGGVDISDAVYLIAYIFAGGPEPCAGC